VALWDGLTINTNETALVFNQLYNKKSISVVSKANGLLWAITGKKSRVAPPGGQYEFDRVEKITGNRMEVKFLGHVGTPTTVADGAAELATVNLAGNYNAAEWGAQEFPLSHYTWAEPIPASELDRFAGDESKTLSFIDEKFTKVMESYDIVWGTGLNSANTQARVTLGGWQWAVSDGVEAAAAYAVYGLLNRADAANADFRSIVDTTGGELTIVGIQGNLDLVGENGGKPDVAPVRAAMMTKVRALVESHTHITQDSKWSEFGNDWVRINGVTFTLDRYAPTGILPLLDSRGWAFWLKTTGFSSGIVKDRSRVAGYVMPSECWIGNVCVRASWQAKMTGLNS
jgi:hypothetical protein